MRVGALLDLGLHNGLGPLFCLGFLDSFGSLHGLGLQKSVGPLFFTGLLGF
jgi:hypothetical protein